MYDPFATGAHRVLTVESEILDTARGRAFHVYRMEAARAYAFGADPLFALQRRYTPCVDLPLHAPCQPWVPCCCDRSLRYSVAATERRARRKRENRAHASLDRCARSRPAVALRARSVGPRKSRRRRAQFRRLDRSRSSLKGAEHRGHCRARACRRIIPAARCHPRATDLRLGTGRAHAYRCGRFRRIDPGRAGA